MPWTLSWKNTPVWNSIRCVAFKFVSGVGVYPIYCPGHTWLCDQNTLQRNWDQGKEKQLSFAPHKELVNLMIYFLLSQDKNVNLIKRMDQHDSQKSYTQKRNVMVVFIQQSAKMYEKFINQTMGKVGVSHPTLD